jgi:subtilisin family serine protease
LGLCLSGTAVAQHGPPDLPVDLPVADRLGDLPGNALGARRDLLDMNALRDMRALELRSLLGANRDVLEMLRTDELIVRSEVLALDPSESALDQALAQGFLVARERELAGVGARMVVLAAPPGLTTAQALDALRALDPSGAYDFNHVYSGSGDVGDGPGEAIETAQLDTEASAPSAAAGTTIGLIDGGVEAEHPAFAATSVVPRAFHPAGYAPSAHGTAVASILVNGDVAPARLLVADVYGGAPTGGAADSVAAALSWMAEEQASVVNISLVGAENTVLDVVLARLAERGVLIVAAVGNDGPAAPPLFPAAHPDVIAVTAIDRRRRVLIEACRGDHVMFAARGVDVLAAALDKGTISVRGTSYAAPVVARRLAALMTAPAPDGASAAVQSLVAAADDLGPPGRDPIYGYGFIDDDAAGVLQASAPGDLAHD